MQILTTGGMEDFCKHLGIRMLSLICCMFWIFSTAEGNTITGVVGSKVILKYRNDSNGTINQLTWKRNRVLLITFMPPSTLHRSPEAVRLNINMSKSQLNTLVIERAQTSHTGNYTCEITKDEAVLEQKWELIIKEGNTITGVVGSKVILKYRNDSYGTINQLTWKRNGVVLITFNPQSPLHRSPEAERLNINMPLSQLNTLVIERAQTSHTGNYTCEITKDEAVLEQKWELIIKDAENSDQLWIVVAVVVPCVCCLIFILALTILLRVRKRRAGDNSPNADMEREEDIYENCLETDVGQRRGHNQRYHCITRTR